MPSWRQRARDLALLFCAALVAYVAWAVLAARLGTWLLAALEGEHSLGLRLLLGTAVLDLSKALPLLLLCWALRRLLSFPPILAAAILVGFMYGIEILACSALGDSHPRNWPILLSRLAGAGLLWVGAWLVLRRRCR